MSFFQCKFCSVILPSKFNIWSHLLKKHGVRSSSEEEEKGWKEINVDLHPQVKIPRLSEDDISDATTTRAFKKTRTPSLPSPPKIVTTSFGRIVKRKRFDDEIYDEADIDNKDGIDREDDVVKDDNEIDQVDDDTEQDDDEIDQQNEDIDEDDGDDDKDDDDDNAKNDNPPVLVSVNDTTSSTVWRYECVPCKQKFRLLIYLRRHRWTVHRQKKPDFCCEICDKSFKVKTLLEYHKLTHDPNWNTYSLEEQKRRKLESRKAVMESRTYKCTHCDKKFIYEAMFRNHCRSHEMETPYKCNTCGAAYRQPYTLQVHLQQNKCEQKILEELSRPFQCDICQSCLKSEKGLRSHRRKQHGLPVLIERPTLKKCLFCEFVATTPSELVNHNRSHTGEKPHACLACGTAYSARHNMRAHMRFHCDVARQKGLDKVVEEEARLFKERNLKLVKKPKLFKCPVCSQSFTTLTMCNKHQRKHGDKYHCEFCNAGYQNLRTLFFHRASAHNDAIKGHKCHLCSKTIRTLSGLKRHYNMVHLVDPPPRTFVPKTVKKRAVRRSKNLLADVRSSHLDLLSGLDLIVEEIEVEEEQDVPLSNGWVCSSSVFTDNDEDVDVIIDIDQHLQMELELQEKDAYYEDPDQMIPIIAKTEIEIESEPIL